MTDRESFILSICEEPACDVRRLAFADWCDEHGEEERAEFIRLQILLAQTPFIRAGGPYAKWPEPWPSRIVRVNKLIRVYGAKWAGSARGFQPKLPPHMFNDWFARGLVDCVRGSWEDFFRLAPAVFREHPVARVQMQTHPYRPDVRGPWMWQRGTRGRFEDSSIIPPAIFDMLPEEGRRKGWTFTTEANAALNTVLVAYGRERAGLSPLTQLTAAR